MTLLVLPCSAFGQVAETFDGLQGRLQPGEQVHVADASGRETQGTVMDLSNSSLQVLVKGERRTFDEANVQKIDRLARDSLKNGVLWGLAIGAGAGVLGMAAVVNSGGSLDATGPVAVFALLAGPVLGAAVGGAIDASKRTRELIYARRSAGRNGVGASVELSARHVGIMIRARF